MGKLSQFLLSLVGSRQDSDAVNVPFKARTQNFRILKWLAAGRTMSSMFLIVNLNASSGASRGREVRKWLRNMGFTICERVEIIDGARVKFWWLAAAERPRLAAMMQPRESSNA